MQFCFKYNYALRIEELILETETTTHSKHDDDDDDND